MTFKDRISYDGKHYSESDEKGKSEIDLAVKKFDLFEKEFEEYNAFMDISKSGNIYIKSWNEDFTQRMYRMITS